jgi:hypothetical protein
MSDLLKPTTYSCKSVGHLVVLEIGGKELQMDHHTALRMAAMLAQARRVHAKGGAGSLDEAAKLVFSLEFQRLSLLFLVLP